MSNYKRQHSAFTLVELSVTIVVSAMFVASIVLIAIAQTRLLTGASVRLNANNLSYQNLRKYANGRAPTWFTCVIVSGTPQSQTLINNTGSVAGLPSPVTQTVVATAPYGCGTGAGNGKPIRVESTVTYGASNQEVRHVTYSSF